MILEPDHVLISMELLLFDQILDFPLLNLIVGRELSQHELLTSSLFLNKRHAIHGVSL